MGYFKYFFLLLSLRIFYKVGIGVIGEPINCPIMNASLGVNLTCNSPSSSGEVRADCFKPLPPGSTIDYTCAKFYQPLLPSYVTRQLHCGQDGVWSNFWTFQEYKCVVVCGQPQLAYTPYIAFGNDTSRYSWPWHAAIFLLEQKTSMYIYVCGGSLISTTMILTAAHCITTENGYSLSSYYIMFGAISSNWSDNLSNESVQKIKIVYKWIPPEYDESTFQSDIALLELEMSVNISELVSPVCFPYEKDEDKPINAPQVIGKGEVIGFGMNEVEEYQLHLKYAQLQILTPEECEKVLPKIPSPVKFCAGVVNGSGVCRGDSGGGLVIRGRGGSRYYIQGIVSSNVPSTFGEKAGCSGPSYFTNVNYFVPRLADVLDERKNLQGNNTSTSNPTPRIVDITTTPISINNASENETILDVCERSCSYITDEREKHVFSRNGTEDALNYFDNLELHGAKSELLCFELDYVEVSAAQLISSLEDCQNLESICLTNIKLAGDFNRKIELPNLKEFKLTSVNYEKLEADEISSRIFFHQDIPGELNQVTYLTANIEIGSKIHGRPLYTTQLLIHSKKKKIILEFGGDQCNDILEQRSKSFILEDLEVTNCEINVKNIPSTLTSLKFIDVKIVQGSLARLIRRQKNLSKILISTNNTFSIDLGELPKGIKKIYYSRAVELKSALAFNEVPEPRINMEEMCVQIFNDQILLQNFSNIFPNLKQLGITGISYPILQHVLVNPPPSLMKIGGFNFLLRFDSNSYEKLPFKTVIGLEDIALNFFFIIERNSSNSQWVARGSSDIEVYTMFWATY